MLAAADQVLSTPRLRLRGFAVRDASPLNALMERPGVPEWLKIARSDGPWAAWWRALRAGGARARRYTITHAGEDRLIGLVGLSREGRLHYLIDPDLWGRGLATEAVGAALSDVLCDPRVERIEAEVFDANPASARVLQKLGFAVRRRTRAQRIGYLYDEPATVYGLTRTEGLAR
ncbi:MAG: GNAT family N-acetyltransferase [Pseudomonadota bacterium]